jgi:hypothetical protein
MSQDRIPPREIRAVPPLPTVIAPDTQHVQAGRNIKPISNEGKPQPSPPPPPAASKKSQ